MVTARIFRSKVEGSRYIKQDGVLQPRQPPSSANLIGDVSIGRYAIGPNNDAIHIAGFHEMARHVVGNRSHRNVVLLWFHAVSGLLAEKVGSRGKDLKALPLLHGRSGGAGAVRNPP
jgi:hypothetical protein